MTRPVYVTFWGTRGSIAKAGPSTVRYGGNTSCVEVRSDDGTLVIIDCGTGAHGLGADLQARAAGAPIDGHLLISHTHWDHIQGLPFFAPLHDPRNRWHVYGPRGLGDSLGETLAGQMQYTYFPVTIDQLAAEVEYHDLVEGSFAIDGMCISTQYLNHPALTLAYRIEADGATVIYASDHEPHDRRLAGGGDIAISRSDRDHAAFFEGADLLIHDCQYLADEYEAKAGWGHSPVEYAVDVAGWAGVEQLAIYHHDPARDDVAVDQIVEHARAQVRERGHDTHVFGAAEGITVELRRDREDTDEPAMATATRDPNAVQEIVRRGVVLVDESEIGAALLEAAAAEQIELVAAADVDGAVRAVDEQGAAFVLFSDGDDGADLARRVRTSTATTDGVALVALNATAGVAIDDSLITDRIFWPASIGFLRTKFRAWLLRCACRWENAPLPADEDRRLARLRALDVLDTEPEARFDRYTELASESLDVPVALVSLVDAERQWFKSRHGIDASETPRDMALCSHAILGDEVFQVPDALHDHRFADNPLVSKEPRLRFYAGVPLKLSDGSRVGTLCVLDYRPRVLDDDQLDELQRLGQLVTSELEDG